MEHKDTLTKRIIGCYYKVHSELGPGFNEKIYHNALKLALDEGELKYKTEKKFVVYYQSEKIGYFFADLVVENKVVVEIKAVTGNIPDVFKYQVISYSKASGLKVGLLVNSGNKSCQIRRLSF
jgi:GxxExxY protein